MKQVYKIAVLPGDGIGPETIESAKQVLRAAVERTDAEFEFRDCAIGGAAIDAFGTPLPEKTLFEAKTARAVLLGSVGGPKWDICPVRPEDALLKLRKELGLYANIRPAKLYEALKGASVLKTDITSEGIDLITVRELMGGIYFGERGFRSNSVYGREAYDTESYSELEIERVARIAFELAQTRRKRVCLVDKANVLTSSKLWRKVVSDINADYPDVTLDMLYVDNAAMQLTLKPSQFDVILTSNMFGDILSDVSAAVVGSIGVMPSASLGSTDLGMYEAIHGSAPSIAGLNVANPLGTILSAAMMLRMSLNMEKEAYAIETAVERTLNDGCKTRDLGGSLFTDEMTNAVIERLQ